MYCTQCGKELREGSRFCPFCGYPVPLEEIESPKQGEGQDPVQQPAASPGQPVSAADPERISYETDKGRNGEQHHSAECDTEPKKPWGESQPREKSQTGSRKKIMLGALVVLLIAVLGIGGYFGVREYQYRSTLSAVDSAFAARDYEKAVALLEELIQTRPEESGNYLTLAQAYLELGDLYGTKETLEEGYAATEDGGLQDVSLWGPISPFEMAMWASGSLPMILPSESLPLTRQEYYFGQQDFVQGYISEYGGVVYVTNYYFDGTGNVTHASMTNYTTGMLGVDGVNRTLWETGWPFMGMIDSSWDYNYDSAGDAVSVEVNDESITISRDNNNSVLLGFDDEQIIIQYSAEGRPTRIILYDGTTYEFVYQEDGGYVAEYSDADYWCEFDENGLFIALGGDDADAFSLKFDDENRVEGVEMNESSYQYEYSETGYLVRIAICNSDGEEMFYETLDYDDSGNLVQITQYSDQERIIYYQMEYDDDGNLTTVTTSDQDHNVTQDIVYEYKQNGQLDYYVSRLHAYLTEEADDLIMVYVPVYDEYGVIDQYTSGEAVYNPGTYTGSADGFGGEVTVEVTVNYMHITGVEVIEQSETAGIGPQAFETLISEMLDTGSPDVDSVTGATISSKAFLDAVDNALREARLYQENSQASAETVYAELDGKTFTLTSGVGNWHTEITFDEGGLFQGTYYDLDMGDTAEEYPNGTCYIAAFNGTMGNVEQIDEYTYSMEIVDLFLDVLVDGEEIEDGVRYVESKYDIEYGDAFELYCPGRRTEDLSDEFLTWLRMPLAWSEDPDELPVYGLYNLRNNDGFFVHMPPQKCNLTADDGASPPPEWCTAS